MNRLLQTLFIAAGVFVAQPALAQNTSDTPDNLIIIVGDGMGMPYTTAYRYFKDGRGMTSAADIQPTALDHHLVGLASTYPADDTLVTDSAAGATAIATGTKTYNGAISVSTLREPLMTMMDYAKEHGFLTGAIATTRVTHATPASFFTHVNSRREEHEIARQFAQQTEAGSWKFDLLLGSGSSYFRYDTEEGVRVDLLADMSSQGMHVIEDMDALSAQQNLPLTGLFYEKNFPFVIDDKPRLRQMVEHGIRLLESQDQPFVLLIEASMIDWCGHANDIACAMNEMQDLEIAFDWLADYVNSVNDTMLVMTADHSTGGLTLGADGEYQWRAAQVARIQHSYSYIETQLMDLPAVDWDSFLTEHMPFPLSSEHQAEFDRIKTLEGGFQQKALHDLLISIVRFHTGSGFTTSGHTGEDVPVYAVGPWKQEFLGFQDHTDIANQYIEWIQMRSE